MVEDEQIPDLLNCAMYHLQSTKKFQSIFHPQLTTVICLSFTLPIDNKQTKTLRPFNSLRNLRTSRKFPEKQELSLRRCRSIYNLPPFLLSQSFSFEPNGRRGIRSVDPGRQSGTVRDGHSEWRQSRMSLEQCSVGDFAAWVLEIWCHMIHPEGKNAECSTRNDLG